MRMQQVLALWPNPCMPTGLVTVQTAQLVLLLLLLLSCPNLPPG